MIALPHAGNWDFAGAWVCAHGWPLTTVAERLKPERLYQRFVAYRESLGMEIIPATGGQPAADGRVARAGRGRGAWCRCWPTATCPRRGVEVEFFGGRTRMPAGPALLALRTGAPLYVVATVVRGTRWSAAGSTGRCRCRPRARWTYGCGR